MGCKRLGFRVERMRSLVFLGVGQLEWQEAEAPRLEPGDALVRPIAVAACDLDAAIVRGQAPFRPPFAIGHEFVGEVEQVGEAVAGFSVGERVAVPFQISCGRCEPCSRGLTDGCSGVARQSSGPIPRAAMYGIGDVGGGWGGALSDVVRVPYADHMLVRLPDEVSPEAAASASDNIADAWRAVAPQLKEVPGSAVLVLNGGAAGSIGLYAVMIAVALGSGRVDFFDRDERRLEVASRLGAESHHLETWPKRLELHPITVDASQEPEGLSCALRSTAPHGHCTSTSIYFQGELPVPITELYMKGITFRTGRTHSRAVLPSTLELIASGRIDPGLVVSEYARWNEASTALCDYTTKLIVRRDSIG